MSVRSVSDGSGRLSLCYYLMCLSGACRWQQQSTPGDDQGGHLHVPSTKEGHQFLGLTGYYRRFIPEFTSIAAPITDLTWKKKPVQVKWTEECEAAFKKLKAMLVLYHVLRSPDASGKKNMLQ